jgi:hypothetical protein
MVRDQSGLVCRTEIIGNKTEGAMICFIRDLGHDYKVCVLACLLVFGCETERARW